MDIPYRIEAAALAIAATLLVAVLIHHYYRS